jgi:hypothetical protein
MSVMEQGPPPGPPPPGPPGAGGPPPALLALLAAHAAAAQGGPPPGVLGPGEAGPEDDEHEPIRILNQVLQLLHRYLTVEPDQEDKAAVAKLLALTQGLLAKDQKDAEAALGGGPATRVLRKLG